jgi:hypothetical protein
MMLSGKKPRKDIETLNRFIVRTILGGELESNEKTLDDTKKVGMELQRITEEEDPNSYREKLSWLYPEEITAILSRVEMKLRENMDKGSTMENKALFSVLWRLSHDWDSIPEVNQGTIYDLLSEQPSYSHNPR